MASSMRHRGPDATGTFVENSVGVGMRRLSIIDLSPLGHQPMANEDGQVQVVYNGEIYNFLELRKLLLEEGHAFRSATDTEVLVHGYEHWGPVELAKRLEGMFAFAVLDRRARKLTLVRGPFGIKPLYVRRAPGQLSFSSEIRAFEHDGLGRPRVDPSFVPSFLSLGYVPSPKTAFRDVVKLRPATVMEIDLATGKETETQYYELRPANIENTSDEQLAATLRECLDQAVARHLIADVPMGIFLSGGLDSSAITMFANRHSRPLATFSMGFSSSDRGDEIGYAAKVAETLGSANVRFNLAPFALKSLDRIVSSLEEPLSDSAVLPLWHLCKGTSSYVKVALSGEGGDETLGGYARYFWAGVADRLSHSALGWSHAVGQLADRLPTRTLGMLNVMRRAGKLAHSVNFPESLRYVSWFEIFSPNEQRALYGTEASEPAANAEMLFKRASDMDLDGVQKLQYVDFHTMLLDNLLMKADKLSMAHSLEVRVPFLSRELVEFGLGLPARSKIGLLRDKRLMRQLLQPRLGIRLANRPKRGFEIPVDRWFREPSADALRAHLPRGPLVSELGFDAAAIDALVARHMGGEDVGRKLFALTALERWAQRFV
jgi:asparagine synthase (glutamine-hydrolysing)